MKLNMKLNMKFYETKHKTKHRECSFWTIVFVEKWNHNCKLNDIWILDFDDSWGNHINLIILKLSSVNAYF